MFLTFLCTVCKDCVHFAFTSLFNVHIAHYDCKRLHSNKKYAIMNKKKEIQENTVKNVNNISPYKKKKKILHREYNIYVSGRKGETI